MRSQHGLRGRSSLSHEIAHVGSRDLKLVLALLIVLPLVLSLSLLLGQPLVLSLHISHVVFFLHGHFVFKHTSHPGHVFCLLSVFLVFFSFVFSVPLMLSLLLVDPVLLSFLVLLLSEAEG
jgi:hypothetical protein